MDKGGENGSVGGNAHGAAFVTPVRPGAVVARRRLGVARVVEWVKSGPGRPVKLAPVVWTVATQMVLISN